MEFFMLVDRDITEPMFFESHEAAYGEMCRQVAEALGMPVEDAIVEFTDGGKDGAAHIGDNSAWLTLRHSCMDWKIYDLELVEG